MKSDTNKEERYYSLYKRLKEIIRPVSRLLFGIREEDEVRLPAEPCLVVANHTCYFDPVIVAMCVDQPLRYVTGENLLRHRLAEFLAVDVFRSIPCSKAKISVKTIRDISRNLKAGNYVCMFAEGNITYDGSTAPLTRVNGKLFRSLQRPVVTLAVTGAYQVVPRWSKKFCRGDVHAQLKGVYTKEMLRDMTPDEIVACFNRDLYVEQPAADSEKVFRRGAKGIHYVLYACPDCGALGKIRGKGNQIRCLSCGKIWKYTESGRIEGGSFETIWQWNRWQETFIRESVRDGIVTKITTLHARLYQILSNHKRRFCESGLLSLDRKKLSCGNTSFALEEISRMDTRNKGVILFSLNNENYYEIRAGKGVSGLMYKTFFQALKTTA
ncbi:MAG: 1-acyl-sn-glycerol-3-phosphate acyltransferase [Lachnospiraceae bacterium]|nr:1-acyl-sn-glycerol-3-phosphate acyltransferase [Lachnospiraceae bacterium]